MHMYHEFTAIVEFSTYFVRIVRLNDQRVQMRENIVFAANVLIDQEVLAFVTEDNMDLLGTWSTNVGSCARERI